VSVVVGLELAFGEVPHLMLVVVVVKVGVECVKVGVTRGVEIVHHILWVDKSIIAMLFIGLDNHVRFSAFGS
jgi:hypothetical protein